MNSERITIYRHVTFLLAAGYFLYMFTVTDLSRFGWQFRYLTIWGLTANLLVAGQMLRLSLKKTTQDWNSLVSLVVVLNAVVVINYWKLYFDDPGSVNNSGQGAPWYLEYYLHLLGPVLMVLDAFLFLGVFRRPLRVCLGSVVLSVAYPVWAELVVAPRNSVPAGRVTNGLPYPFLNHMELSERLMFYGGSAMANFLLIGVCVLIARRLQAMRGELSAKPPSEAAMS